MPLLPPPPSAKRPSDMYSDSPLASSLSNLSTHLGTKRPSSILVVSAHWETEDGFAVSSSARPTMFFDYGGFPAETYQYRYDAPGSPELADEVAALVRGTVVEHGEYRGKAVPCTLDPKRGFDHGVFVPLMLAFPDHDIPVVCLSLHQSLDPDLHLAVGASLAPLREKGVLIICSGSSFHNMRAFKLGGGAQASDATSAAGAAFDAALRRACGISTGDPAVAAAGQQPEKDGDDGRAAEVAAEGGSGTSTGGLAACESGGAPNLAALAAWRELSPDATFAHPREEHLIPLLVAAGAAQGSPATSVLEAVAAGAAMSSFRFG